MRKAIRKTPASYWWRSLGDTFDRVIRYQLHKARQAELRDTGHECGHSFEITIRSSLHFSGEGEHVDAFWTGPYDDPVVVRAHNLRDALLVAAALPLSAWITDGQERS